MLDKILEKLADPIVIATIALVVITAFYAWQTRATVAEMRRARGQAVLPRLKVSIQPKVAGIGWIRISNVGPGAALDVTTTTEPLPGGDAVVWQAHVVAPGETHDFVAHEPGSSQILARLDELTARFDRVRMRAEYSDALGARHHVDETIEIRDWWVAAKGAHHLVVKDWDEEQAKELEKIEGSVRKLADELQRIRQAREPSPWAWEYRIARWVPARYRKRATRLAKWVRLIQ